MDLSEKIGIVAKEMFCRMLGITELPDFLLLAYFRVKKLVDKVDGVMSPCDLARIAMDCGFDPDTMNFDNRVSGSVVIMPETTTGTPVQPPVDFTPVDVPPEAEPYADETARPITTPVALYLVGQNVEIKQNDDILSGKIVGVPSGKKKTYTVMTEDEETYEVDESDIDEG